MTRICIVGHGPSMLQNRYGDWIDSHDVVVRLKEHRHLMVMPEHFGTKRTVHAYSLILAPKFYQAYSCIQWIIPDTRNNPDARRRAESDYPDAIIKNKLLGDWNEQYRHNREKILLDRRQVTTTLGGEYGHNHMSQGLAAICYALKAYFPKELSLPGFDNLLSGEFNPSLALRPWDKTGNEYPDHNWPAERKTLYQMLEHYGTEIRTSP